MSDDLSPSRPAPAPEPIQAGDPAGPLAGLRVVELAGDWSPMAGKLLADMGADVVLVEPAGGHHTRGYEPFWHDEPDPEHSLWWWAYHTSKRGIDLDLATDAGRDRLLNLVRTADVFLESEMPGRLASLGLNDALVWGANPGLIWTSITTFGLGDERSRQPATDLTHMAGAGPVWMCGYDDHSLPPVRGEGGQAMNVGSVQAVNATLAALFARPRGGGGQRIDVSVHAALNVSTETATYEWLTMGSTVMRQTGRHASAAPTLPTQIGAADGRWVTTGFPPRHLKDIEALLGWLEDLGLDDSSEGNLLRMAVEQGGIDMTAVRTDPLAAAMYGAGREALCAIAAAIPALEFFTGAQERGLAVGVINSPEAALSNVHIEARHAFAEVAHEDVGAVYRYAGAPFVSAVSPYRVRWRAPHVGEHNSEFGW